MAVHAMRPAGSGRNIAARPSLSSLLIIGRCDHGKACTSAMVPRGDRTQRCLGSAGRCLHLEGPEAHRRVAEALRAEQQAKEGRSIPLGAVDADVLHQPRGQEPAGLAPTRPDASQGRIAQAVRAGVKRRGGQPGSMSSFGKIRGSAWIDRLVAEERAGKPPADRSLRPEVSGPEGKQVQACGHDRNGDRGTQQEPHCHADE